MLRHSRSARDKTEIRECRPAVEANDMHSRQANIRNKYSD